MGFAFNPFTGTFDVKGAGGGGGSAFFAGEVPTYADLPLDGTAALDSRWLVRSNSGTWPFSSYKQAGVYVRVATVGSSRDNDYRLTDTSFFDVMSDSAFLIYDDGDATRNLKFQLSGIPTASTVTLTAPAASGTIARTETFAAPPSIGNTTPAAGSFTTLSTTPAANTTALTSTGYSLTGSNAQSLIDLSGTWNTTGVPIAFKTNLTVTAAGTNSMYADFQAGGYSQAGIARISGTSNALWLYNANSGTNTNGIGANYERGFLRWSSNVLQIGTEKGGSGSARALEFQTDGVTRLTCSTGGTVTINTFGARLDLSQQVRIAPQGGGILALIDGSTGNSWDRLQFGGTTSSYPALKRSSTALQVRLANDSAFAPVECAGLTLNGDLTASTRNIVTDTTTGTKIGTGTTQLLGFWNATPAAQPAAVADATDAATVITQLNALLARLRTVGIIAT